MNFSRKHNWLWSLQDLVCWEKDPFGIHFSWRRRASRKLFHNFSHMRQNYSRLKISKLISQFFHFLHLTELILVYFRYVTAGDNYKSITYNFRMGDRTFSNIIREVAIAVWKQMQPRYLREPTTHTCESVASTFEQTWQFLHRVGQWMESILWFKNLVKVVLPIIILNTFPWGFVAYTRHRI